MPRLIAARVLAVLLFAAFGCTHPTPTTAPSQRGMALGGSSGLPRPPNAQSTSLPASIANAVANAVEPDPASPESSLPLAVDGIGAIVNGSFESGNLSPWTKWPTPAPGIVAVESCCGNRTPGGTWNAYIQPQGAYVAIYQSIPVKPGQVYRLRAWVATNGMTANLAWWSNANGGISKGCASTSVVWPAYAELSCTLTIPAETTSFNVQLNGNAPAGKWAVTDDWSLDIVPDAASTSATIYAVSIRSSGSNCCSFEESRARARYLAEAGGGVYFKQHTAPGASTLWTLVDLNNGTLESGDKVHLRATNGKYLVAEQGGGDVLNANRTDPLQWETFTILKLNGYTPVAGTIGDGDGVAFQTWDSVHYVQAELGGVNADGTGGGVNARPIAINTWESMNILFSTDTPWSLPPTPVSAEPYFKLQFLHAKYNPTGPSRSSNCGPASLAMVLKLLGYQSATMDVELTIDHARYLMFNRFSGEVNGIKYLNEDGNVSSISDIAAGVARIGGETGTYQGWDVLDQKLVEGKPVIAWGYLDDDWRAQFTGSVGDGYVGHINAIIGKMADGQYIVMDPMHRGGPVAMTRDRLKVFFRKDDRGYQRPQATYEVPTFLSIALPYNAAFISAHVPMTMIPGTTTAVRVTMKNMAPLNYWPTWTRSNYFRLGSQSPQDNMTWGLLRAELPNDVMPRSTVAVDFTIRAPASPGTYNFQWRMLKESDRWFGAYTRIFPIVVHW